MVIPQEQVPAITLTGSDSVLVREHAIIGNHYGKKANHIQGENAHNFEGLSPWNWFLGL